MPTRFMRQLLPAALVLLVLASADSGRAADYYVAPTGSDANPGTLERPFLTIEKARDTVRLLAPAMNADIVVHLRGGVYPLSKTIVFGPPDSGHNGHKVVYQAQEQEKPVLSGMRTITGWTVHDAAKGIYQAPAGNLDFRQIYLDGALATRARFPNVQSATDLGPYLWMVNADDKSKRYCIAKADWNTAADATNKAVLELVVHVHWIHHTVRFASAVPQGNLVWITPQLPERDVAFNKPVTFYQKCSYFWQNAYEFIDADGEWFRDPVGQKLYCKLPPAATGKVVCEVPSIDTLIEIIGTAATPVHDLEFRGLTLEGSNWTNPSQRGLVATQFAQPYNAKRSYENPDYPPGMIRAAHAQRIAFRHNVIWRAGATGIQFWANVDDSDIEANYFSDIAANAIEIDVHAAKNPPPEMQSSNIAIWNNDFRRAGCVYSNGGAILAHFVQGLIVEHNEISDMPYSGMQIGDQPGAYAPCGCTGNKIRFNHVHHTNRQHDDGGGIYTLGGQQQDSEIVGNYIHDVRRSAWTQNFAVMGIYLDNKTQFVKVAHNVIEQCTGSIGQLNKSKDNAIFANNPKDPAKRAAIIKNAGIKPGYSPRQP